MSSLGPLSLPLQGRLDRSAREVGQPVIEQSAIGRDMRARICGSSPCHAYVNVQTGALIPATTGNQLDLLNGQHGTVARVNQIALVMTSRDPRLALVPGNLDPS